MAYKYIEKRLKEILEDIVRKENRQKIDETPLCYYDNKFMDCSIMVKPTINDMIYPLDVITRYVSTDIGEVIIRYIRCTTAVMIMASVKI